MLDLTPNPVALQIGPFPIYWYGIGYAVGLALAYLLLVRLAKRAGEDPDVAGNGIIIVAVNGAWMTILFGMVSARFRDVPPLVGNIIQILMFVTPIFWFSSQLGPGAQPIITYNFMFHLIEVMRAPMLGAAPAPAP